MLHPYEFLNLSYSYDSIIKLIDKVNIFSSFDLYGVNIECIDKFKSYIDYYKSVFNILEMGKYGLANITSSFFQKGCFKEIDDIQVTIDDINNFYQTECSYLSNVIEPGSDVVKLDFNDREGYFYYCTKKRADLLIEKLTAIKSDKKYEIKKFNGSNVKIVSPTILEKSDKLIEYQNIIQKVVKEKYLGILADIEKNFRKILEEITRVIAELDVVKAGAKCAVIYGYTCPIINNKYDGQSYFSAKQIRHPIIEVINQERQYIGNDVELLKGDEDVNGILLYGVNGVGKSSLGKAVGINIVLAQMGFYTATSGFTYYPYNKIFTRINGDDNIFKGMSSFVVEMSELKSILKYADNRSIVIGDEVCKGTEETSALSIVSASVANFCVKNVNFIFATHFHKLYELSCIKVLKNIRLCHLSVTYDNKNENIIYGRVLENGPGSDLYGLEIAGYIIKDDVFMQQAKSVRNEIMNLNNQVISDKVSNYNSGLIVDKCMICGDNGSTYPLDTHHIIEQNTFECDNSFHKNKLANLVVLCKTHHDEVHHGNLKINGYKDTINGQILDYEYTTTINNDEKIENKKYDKMQISIIKDIYNKYKDLKPSASTTVIKAELKKHGMNIAIKTVRAIVDGNY
jgi:DNA mismatch repair protein MutS